MATTTSAIGVLSQPTAKQQGTPASPVTRSITVVIAYILLIGFALAMVLPFVYAISNSFKDPADITAHPELLLPTMGVSVASYSKILHGDFPRWLFNSVFVAIAITVGHLVFDSMAAYALARINFPGRRLAFAGVVGTMMVPSIVLLIPRFLVFRQLGMVDQYSGLILPGLADAFGIFLMKQFFEGIPIDIEEAAAMDGASRFRMFFVVILPMAIPALTALAIFGFQGSWNDFTGPLIALSRSQELYTLPLGLAKLRGVSGGSSLPWDMLLSGSVITTLPMALIFFVFQRFFIEGVTYTGVKG